MPPLKKTRNPRQGNSGNRSRRSPSRKCATSTTKSGASGKRKTRKGTKKSSKKEEEKKKILPHSTVVVQRSNPSPGMQKTELRVLTFTSRDQLLPAGSYEIPFLCEVMKEMSLHLHAIQTSEDTAPLNESEAPAAAPLPLAASGDAPLAADSKNSSAVSSTTSSSAPPPLDDAREPITPTTAGQSPFSAASVKSSLDVTLRQPSCDSDARLLALDSPDKNTCGSSSVTSASSNGTTSSVATETTTPSSSVATKTTTSPSSVATETTTITSSQMSSSAFSADRIRGIIDKLEKVARRSKHIEGGGELHQLISEITSDLCDKLAMGRPLSNRDKKHIDNVHRIVESLATKGRGTGRKD